MKCQKCNINEATVYYQEMVNGRKTQLALCQSCAAEIERESGNTMFMNPFGNSLFGSLFSSPLFSMGSQRKRENQSYSRLTQNSKATLAEALNQAQELGHSFIGSEHMLLGLIISDDGISSKILKSRGITKEKVIEEIIKERGKSERTDLDFTKMTPMAKKLIDEAGYTAAKMGHRYIGTEHILCAMLIEESSLANKIITSLGGSVIEISNELSDYFNRALPQGDNNNESQQSNELSECPNISKYGINLVEKAKMGKIDPIIGRDEETERVIQILSRRTKNNPCLIGEPGVGKTAVVEGLAQKIADKDVPENLLDKTIVTLDLSSMIAGAKYRGEFEERMKGVMEEVTKNPNIILFVDEIHTIIGAGGADGAVDAANILKPALARGQIQLIGATTINEYRKYIEKDAAFERRFQSVTVGEPTPDEALQILYGLRDKYEAHHNLKISDEALEAAVKLSVRYIGERFLPDKAIDLIDEAASRLRIKGLVPSSEVKELDEKLKQLSQEKEEAILNENYEKAAELRNSEKEIKEKIAELKKSTPSRETTIVGVSEIEDVVTAWTGIPVKKLAEDEGEKLLHLDKILKEKVIGQDEAVEAVARAIRRGRTGLKDPKRPVGSFIFLGPTGVGKTELTKALAEVMFGDENAMIRVDMSEYMEKHSVSKMIGSPPGYVGYDEGGQLTEKIRRHPYSVVLFDEIEKAHPDVFNILLQILDDGILTDAMGRRVDFKNTIIIMTSNVGQNALIAPKHLGFVTGNDTEDIDMKDTAKAALKETFRPEFLNRIDEIIVFNKLSDDDIKKIAGLMLESVKERLAIQNITIEFDDDVISMLAKEGFDPVYGARPLRRAIMRRIEDSFSESMLRGEIAAGDNVKASLEDNTIKYTKI